MNNTSSIIHHPSSIHPPIQQSNNPIIPRPSSFLRRSLLICGLVLSLARHGHAQSTAFTYQGKLNDGSNPASGLYDMTFTLFDSATGLNQIGLPVSAFATPVTNGLFTTSLDFGSGPFTGPARWLEIQVKTNTSATYNKLTPRTALSPTPYAIYAQTAGTVTNSAITSSKIASGQVVKSLNGLTDAVSLAPGTNVSLVQSGNTLTINSSGSGAFSLNGTNAYYNRGYVGIGTTSPAHPFEVQAPAAGYDAFSWGILGTEIGRLGCAGGLNVGWLGLYNNGTRNVDIRASGPSYLLGGNFGIGTANPSSQLDLFDGSEDLLLNGDGIVFTRSTGPGYIQANNRIDFVVGNGVNNQGGDAGSILTLNSDPSLGGQCAIFRGPVTVPVLTITGGSDVAEPFRMPECTPKGAVVVIDEKNPGNLKISETAYDTHVAGIVSGADGINPGLSLHQEGVLEGGQNVALSGRVKVLADASNGAIKPGDLLTTSEVPGHCMKVTNHGRAQGAIIGKAMSSLASGKGYVLVLVSLQ
ncbi:MAG: hypothetical protein C5B50_28110 [Verrucomicrobia bacterium]|nr:MAG: hypothetical protein C5B50_28110 [Verrucomicrobiota bacterium]